MDVSVIIVNYKTSNLIINCLESIREMTEGLEYEVVVVDNASEKDFEEKIKSAVGSFPNLSFLALPENIGFGCANNAALKQCSGRNIFFLNPDTILLNNAIKILSDFLDNNARAGACGGNLLGEDMKPVLSFKRVLPDIGWELDELLHNSLYKAIYKKNQIYNHTGKPFPVGYITGADLMVKAKVLKKTGAFRSDYFMYYEESDLCARIKRIGLEIYSVPRARIQHLVSKSFGPQKYNPRKLEMIEKSRNTYYRLNHSPLKRKVCDTIYSLFLRSRCHLSNDPDKKAAYRLRLKYYKSTK